MISFGSLLLTVAGLQAASRADAVTAQTVLSATSIPSYVLDYGMIHLPRFILICEPICQ